MVTRKEKREAEKNTNFFLEFIRIKNHFFKDLNEWLRGVKDPRHQSYITYLPDVILYVMILKNIMGLISMRETTDKLNKDECIKNIEKMLGIEGLEELPHYDTMNDFLSELDPSELEKIRVFFARENSPFLQRFFPRHRWGIFFVNLTVSSVIASCDSFVHQRLTNNNDVLIDLLLPLSFAHHKKHSSID